MNVFGCRYFCHNCGSSTNFGCWVYTAMVAKTAYGPNDSKWVRGKEWMRHRHDVAWLDIKSDPKGDFRRAHPVRVGTVWTQHGRRQNYQNGETASRYYTGVLAGTLWLGTECLEAYKTKSIKPLTEMRDIIWKYPEELSAHLAGTKHRFDEVYLVTAKRISCLNARRQQYAADKKTLGSDKMNWHSKMSARWQKKCTWVLISHKTSGHRT
jgi:hypothetical protein